MTFRRFIEFVGCGLIFAAGILFLGHPSFDRDYIWAVWAFGNGAVIAARMT